MDYFQLFSDLVREDTKRLLAGLPKKEPDCDVCNDKVPARGEGDCQHCCPHDWDEYCCLNCGIEKDWGAMADRAQDALEDR